MHPVYEAYGLRIQSELCLPEVPLWQPAPAPEAAAAHPVDPDVRVRFGSVPASLEGGVQASILWQAAPGRYLMSADGVARFLIAEGRHVTIDPDPAATDADIRSFLLGSVCAVLLHTCGLLPLHASSIHTGRGALVFLGRSGAGKSTLLSALLERGHTMVADDVTAVKDGGGGPALACPGYPRVRLWESALRAMGEEPERLQRLRPSLQKYLLPADRFVSAPVPIVALFELVETNEPAVRVEELSPAVQLARCSRYVRRTRLFRTPEDSRIRFERLGSLLRAVRMRQILRPHQPFQPRALAALVEGLEP